MSDDDLEMRTTDELIAELMRRFDHGAFTAVKVTVDEGDGTGDTEAIHVWKGEGLTCTGLLAECQHRILNRRQESHTETEL